MFVKFLDEIEEPKFSELGGKGYCLAILSVSGFNIPRGFIILSQAFFEHLKQNKLMERVQKLASEINENNLEERSREIRELILSGEFPLEIVLEVEVGLRKLNANFVSVRSSAVSEDSLKSSFAGLHDTFLNVKSELKDVLGNVKKCWASLFSERAVIYRVKKGIPHLEGMAVIVQEMIPAEVAGVTFTIHPINKKLLLIEAAYGIGDMLVSGRVEPDEYLVDRETLEVVERRIGKKDKMSVIKDGNIKVLNVKRKLLQRQVLPDEKIKAIAKIGIEIEKKFNYPQDIEWCISDSKLWLLQSRAITGIER
jgi:pyruvate,water dikinase